MPGVTYDGKFSNILLLPSQERGRSVTVVETMLTDCTIIWPSSAASWCCYGPSNSAADHGIMLALFIFVNRKVCFILPVYYARSYHGQILILLRISGYGEDGRLLLKLTASDPPSSTIKSHPGKCLTGIHSVLNWPPGELCYCFSVSL